MDFELTRENLNLLSEQNSCAPEEFLNIVYDFCKDIERSSGRSPASVAAKNIDILMEILPWAGQFIINMAGTNEPQLLNMSVDRRRRLNRLTADLEKISKQVEAENNVCQKIKESEQELVREKNELLRIKMEQQEILASCDKLRQEIDQLSNVDSNHLKEEEERLIDQKSELEEELKNARIKNEGINTDISSLINLLAELQNELNQKNDELRIVDNDVSITKSEIERVKNSINEGLRTHEEYMKEKRALEEKLDEDKQKYINEIAEIDKIIENKMQERDKLQQSKEDEEEKERGVKQEILNVENAIEGCKLNYDKLRKELTERENQRDTLDKQAEKLDKQVIAIRKEIDDKNVSMELAGELKDELINIKDELDKNVTKVNSECARLREKIRILDRNLQEKNFNEQIRILEEEKHQKEESLKKYDDTQKDIKGIEKEIENLKADQTSAEAQLQNEKLKLQEVQEVKLERLKGLQQQKSEMKSNIKRYEMQIQLEEAWMKSIEACVLKEQAERLLEKVIKLGDVRNKLEEVLQSSWHQTRYSKAAVQTAYIGQVMRDDMNDMKNKLEEYRDKLIGVIECLGSGHQD